MDKYRAIAPVETWVPIVIDDPKQFESIDTENNNSAAPSSSTSSSSTTSSSTGSNETPDITASAKLKIKKSILNSANLRQDGRNLTSLRPLFIRTSMISQANGSAYIEMNQTKVICAVYGPRPIKSVSTGYSELGRLNCFFQLATFSVPSTFTQLYSYKPSTEEEELSVLIEQALVASLKLDSFPKSEVDVFIIVLENSGSAFGAAISCASLALADAGVEMYDLVSSCSVGSQKRSLVLDPTFEEEQYGLDTQMTVSIMPNLNEITQMHHRGETEFNLLTEKIELGIDGCSKVIQ